MPPAAEGEGPIRVSTAEASEEPGGREEWRGGQLSRGWVRGQPSGGAAAQARVTACSLATLSDEASSALAFGSGTIGKQRQLQDPPEMMYCSSGLKATEVAKVMCAPFTCLITRRLSASITSWSPAAGGES